MLTYEGDISNYLGVNIKKNPYGTLELFQSYFVEKIINQVGLTVSESLKAREIPDGKPLLHLKKVYEDNEYVITGQRLVC